MRRRALTATLLLMATAAYCDHWEGVSAQSVSHSGAGRVTSQQRVLDATGANGVLRLPVAPAVASLKTIGNRLPTQRVADLAGDPRKGKQRSLGDFPVDLDTLVEQAEQAKAGPASDRYSEATLIASPSATGGNARSDDERNEREDTQIRPAVSITFDNVVININIVKPEP